MAGFFRGLIDRILLIASMVIGGLIPGFIAQYRQRLGGRLDQAKLDLEAWQHIADRFHQGDLNRLIEYHLASTDRTFHAEGEVIRSLVLNVQQLQAAVDAMQGTLFQQVQFLAVHLDAGLARATYADWVPTFALSAEGLAFASLFALVVWGIFHAIWALLSLGTRVSLRRSGSAGPYPASSARR